MSFSNSHYERLNVPERASSKAIQAAWRDAVERQRRACSQSPIAQAVALADIHAAYDVLSDPQRRAHYDQKLAACRDAGRGTADAGLPQHSANDEDAATPARMSPGEAAASGLELALSMRSLLVQLTREAAGPSAWPGGAIGVAALTVAAVLAAAWVVVSDPAVQGSEARHLQRGGPMGHAASTAEAHGHWLVVAARTAPHPLDGEPLQLRR